MITPGYGITASERVLPRLAIDFTTAITDARVTTTRANNTATRFNASGAIEVVNANLARYTFDPITKLCQGQLIEEARTNLFLNSLIDGSNLSTQSVTLSATAYTLSFYGTGSVVISGGHSATVTGLGAFPTQKTYVFTPTAGSSTFTISGTVGYAQLEAGAFATSFIPTSSTSVLRNSDVVSMTGANFSSWYNATEGTFVASGYAVYNTAGANPVVYVSDGTETNYIRMLANNIGTGTVVTGGVSQAAFSLGGPTPNSAANDYVLAYKASNFFAAYNSASGSSATGSVPTVNRLQIGQRPSGALMSGTIKRIFYYPQRLTNNECLTLSVRSVRGA